MLKKTYGVLVLVIVLGLVAACGGGGADTAATTGSATAGNAANGETLFKQALIGKNPGCATCHSVDGKPLVGPTLQGVATRAGTRVSGETADQYLHKSMVDPNAFVVEGFVPGVMLSYKDLTEQQLNDLVAYLQTLK